MLKDLLISLVEGIPSRGSKVPWYNCRLHSWMWAFGRSQHKSPETICCPYSQPYSSHSGVVKGLGGQIWIHLVSCFPLRNYISWALAEPRKEKSVEGGNLLDVGTALQPTCQTPVLEKWIKDHMARQKTAVRAPHLACCKQLLTSSRNTSQL